MSDDALRGALVFGVIFSAGLGVYLIWLCVEMAKRLRLVKNTPPPAPKMPTRLLPIIQAFYSDTEYNYIATVAVPGQLVLAWREWAGDGYKDRALDVLLVRANGTVETLGTCVDYEVFGPPSKPPSKE
jgi:hypothetical protein